MDAMEGLHVAADVAELEDLMADGWWPLEHDRLGGWLLRASEGFTGRGNSALAIGDPGRPLDDAINAVEEFYRERGLPPRFAVPTPEVGQVSGGLADVLDERGYDVVTPTAVMTGFAGVVTGHVDSDPDDVRLAPEPDAGWLSVYRYRGSALEPVALDLLLSAPHQVFASIERDGFTVAVGRLAVSRGWGGITAMEVAETYRGQGLARAVLTALAAYAADRGAPNLYLQVSADNAPARRLYASAGFADHHGYHYRVLS
jgi:ribosomal protein S18 acetylase RimI-like enzyme